MMMMVMVLMIPTLLRCYSGCDDEEDRENDQGWPHDDDDAGRRRCILHLRAAALQQNR